jgi:hypothetical protein
MFMIVHYKTRNLKDLKEWDITYPIDQLTDQYNMPLVFKSKNECLEALELWGVNMNDVHTVGFEIMRVH